jgi:hypothetical protein
LSEEPETVTEDEMEEGCVEMPISEREDQPEHNSLGTATENSGAVIPEGTVCSQRSIRIPHGTARRNTLPTATGSNTSLAYLKVIQVYSSVQ